MKELYKKKGQTMGSVGAIIGLITGIGVSVMVLIFVGVLAGQTYQLTESKIDAITNDTVKTYVKDSIVSGFSALKTTGDYLPIIVLAVIIAIVLSLVLGLTAFGGGRGGSAL
jgi:hypothetical protein